MTMSSIFCSTNIDKIFACVTGGKMKRQDKNIIMITAGGIGERFGGNIPKQFIDMHGRPVIAYVIDACKKSRLADAILVVADQKYHAELVSTYGVNVAESGEVLNITKRNGFDYIREHSSCEKLIVVEACRPTVDSSIIDRFFMLLDEYDAVACARKITDSLGRYGEWIVNREEYYTMNPPEGFRFSLIDRYFKSESECTESIQQLPESSKVFLDFNVPYFDKVTYPEDLERIWALLHKKEKLSESEVLPLYSSERFEKAILYSDGILKFLYIRERDRTIQWIDQLHKLLPTLFARWLITSFTVNQIARYGIILLADSAKYGKVAVKCIPDFVGIYEREKEAITLLSPAFMCPLIDCDDTNSTMLLKQISPAEYASLDRYQRLISFFNRVRNDAVMYDPTNPPVHIPFYIDELKYRFEHASQVPYLSEPIRIELENALKIWEMEFASERLYIIHGDLHEMNVLDNGKQLWGIDPSGFIAPLVFEYVRFIRNDIRNHQDFGYEERFDVLCHCFEQLAARDQLIAAFIVDMAFCTYNSTFENVDMEETLLNLKLIEIAHKKFRQN